jgi:choline dehydrogenase-like flavoprotein
MLEDATHLAAGEEPRAEVAVVGAGPAGIVLATELARSGRHVLLLESGGESHDARSQRLGDTAGEDPPHAPMALATRRQLGGASNLWAGRCVPFDPIDFEPRAITGGARWPVAYDELRGYFGRACEWLVCGEPAFDASEIPSLAGRSLVPGWPGGELGATALERWSLPTNFRRRHGALLRTTPRLTVMTHATCVEIVCGADGRSVEHLAVRAPDGRRLRVRADRYVLACGGLEGTRLLLASNGLHRHGIGNHAGHLGRWYMGHVEVSVADVRFATPPGDTVYGYERDPDGVYVRRRFTFAPRVTLERELPNAAFWLNNPRLGDAGHRSGVLSLLYLALLSPLGGRLVSEAIRLRQIETAAPSSVWRHLANVSREPAAAATFVLSASRERLLRRGHKLPGVYVPSAANVYPLNYHGEHLPNRDSRVTLSAERDALGMPRLCTRLRFAEEDVEGAIRAHRCFDGYLRRHGLGRLALHDDPRAEIRRQLFGGYHQAGTTRMSARPEDGVLDRDLAVHGFDDLYVASSSAFVTSSQANTTFMIVAFALRLADHLRRELRRAPPRPPHSPASTGGM